jgi:hypothetical protein
MGRARVFCARRDNPKTPKSSQPLNLKVLYPYI